MRVLVVDDEPDLRELYAVNLKEAGHEVLTAANGAEGLGLLKGTNPDVILVDLMMPVMDGYEFLHHLRKMPEHRGTPAIVVSAVATGAFSRKLGASGFVAKPFDADELVSVVERCAA